LWDKWRNTAFFNNANGKEWNEIYAPAFLMSSVMNTNPTRREPA